MDYQKILDTIGYNFKDPELLSQALTHSSYRRERPSEGEDNERLEFIGDAILDAVIGTELYSRLPKEHEGVLTKLRSLIVCERSLSNVGREIGLNTFIKLGTGERHTGGEFKDSIIADAMEALIGAIFLDGGYETARERILCILSETIEKAIDGKLFNDYKSELQEYLQRREEKPEIIYVTDRAEGPDHNKVFFVHVEAAGVLYGRGSGKSKKEAGQNAAREALEKLRGR
ncbi:MAG: ribonuclease III [Firmicutes bacterium]|nr:ribonuclease III [Bacillota bacterium]